MEVNGVEFQEEEYIAPRPTFKEVGNRMAAWLIKNKIAKTPIQANGVLLAVIGISIIVGIGAMFVGSKKPIAPSRLEQAIMNAMNSRR